jgi:predicted RNA-binding protein with PUA-like domain
MSYWLVKSEPFVFSYQQLVADGKSMWDGVRNYQARNNLRAMKEGDLVLFYHSNEGLEVVGIAQVTAEAYPDPTAEKGDWSVVDLAPYRALNKSVPLKDIKATPELQEVGLVRNPRLSVMPLSAEEFSKILEMGETEV